MAINKTAEHSVHHPNFLQQDVGCSLVEGAADNQDTLPRKALAAEQHIHCHNQTDDQIIHTARHIVNTGNQGSNLGNGFLDPGFYCGRELVVAGVEKREHAVHVLVFTEGLLCPGNEGLNSARNGLAQGNQALHHLGHNHGR